MSSERTKWGGPWLGAARRWLQWNKANGSGVTWGSTDVIQPPMTAANVDDMAARIADAVYAEMDVKAERDTLPEPVEPADPPPAPGKETP